MLSIIMHDLNRVLE